jgi:hypothetical protein
MESRLNDEETWSLKSALDTTTLTPRRSIAGNQSTALAKSH